MSHHSPFGEERERTLAEFHRFGIIPHDAYLRSRMETLRPISSVVRQDIRAGLSVRCAMDTPDIVDHHALGHRMLLPSVVGKHLEQLLCLQGDRQVSPHDISRDEIAIRAFHGDPVLRLAMMRQLHRMGLIRFPKSWCWKVDRTAKEYDERFGFGTLAAVAAFAEIDEPVAGQSRILLEWGSGNGNFKSQVERSVGHAYRCFAVNDAIHIPPQGLMRRLIDVEKLARDIGAGDEFDRDAFVEFVTLVTLQKPGTYDTDMPLEDDEVMRDLEGDLAALLFQVRRKAALLPAVECIRDPSGAMRGADVVYPDRMQKSAQPGLDAACRAFAARPDRYITANDIGTMLARAPAHIAGVLPASFEQAIGKIASATVDVSLAVRSTEYVPDAMYVDFQADMARVLAPEGIFIDDSVRRNYGAGNRLAELRQVQERVGFPLYVIFGPGHDGEDRGGLLVPHSFVMTRDARKVGYLRGGLLPGYVMRPLSEIPA